MHIKNLFACSPQANLILSFFIPCSEKSTPKGRLEIPEPFMSIFSELDALLLSQDTRHTSAADALLAVGVPTTSIAILEKGSISSHIISTLDADSDTLFQACSISKAVTATAVFKAVQSDHLSLDAPISTYLSPDQLSWIQTPQTAHLVQYITVEMLLSHTSGLSVHGFGGYPSAPAGLPDILRGAYPSNSPHVCLEGLPGHQYSYSGGGFTVLELVLEAVFKKPFPDFMQEFLFTPLGMYRSYFVLPVSESNFAPAYSTAYTVCKPPFHIQPEQAAAGLWTTPSDILRVVSAIHSSIRGSGFLEPKWAKLMLSEVNSGKARGWTAPKGEGVFMHGGSNDPGYRCLVLGYSTFLGPSNQDPTESAERAQDCGICIMTNSALGIEAYNKLVLAITFLKKWPSGPMGFGGSDFDYAPFTYDATIDARWKDWVGDWVEVEQNEASGHSEPNDQRTCWSLRSHDDLPVLQYRNLPSINLYTAAVPPSFFPEGKGESIDLVLNGLQMMLRLGWKADKRTIELWTGEMKTLERTKEK